MATQTESELDDAMLQTLLAAEPHDAARWLSDAARHYVDAHGPEPALRFLFQLDERLYALQGQTAVAYGGGIHTKHRHMRYHDFFVERIRAGESVLDIGCGNGAVAYDVATRSGARVTGIDINAANIRLACERHACPNVHYVRGNVLTDLPGDHYDVVILSNVLEHLERRVEFLRRVDRAATPTRWLVRVPLFERDWRVPLKKELGLEWRLDPTHCTEYTQESFEEEVRATGLAVVHRETRWGEVWSELCQAGREGGA